MCWLLPGSGLQAVGCSLACVVGRRARGRNRCDAGSTPEVTICVCVSSLELKSGFQTASSVQTSPHSSRNTPVETSFFLLHAEIEAAASDAKRMFVSVSLHNPQCFADALPTFFQDACPASIYLVNLRHNFCCNRFMSRNGIEFRGAQAQGVSGCFNLDFLNCSCNDELLLR